MSMEKRGVVTKVDIDVIGASCDDGYICSSCNKIVMSNNSKNINICPFCGADRSSVDEKN